ncbi:unnamed protein product [Gongylonema pulchrum]|uniref:Storkhead-box protein 1 n=1 Tax=Gongylonema pulchrum TaxID=637853 RepID=A0A183E228_9BILA|nr:unnamed protein product [Gongylonema pulchrum]
MMLTPCLGIIFQRVADRKIAGHKLFLSFIEENRASFWNVELVEAVEFLRYIGYLKPSTLFVTSKNDRYMQVLRDAWTRRFLKPANGYKIESLCKYFAVTMFNPRQEIF